MLRNYIKIAWRNIINKKLYSAINIIGLTVGLAVGLLILLWVQDETSYDKFNTRIDRIYKMSASMGTGVSKQIWPWVQPPVAFYALKEVPEVENAVRVMYSWPYSKFTYLNKSIRVTTPMKFVDDSFFSVFDYKLLKGDPKKPFPNDQSVILSESEANKYFGKAEPIGKVLKANNNDLYTVSGVIADMPANSSIQAGMLFSTNLKKREYDGKGMWKSMNEDWGDYYTDTYLLLKPNASTTAVADKLTRIHQKLQKSAPGDGVYQLQSLADVHLYNPDGTSAGAQIVKIFSIVALLILLIACINYVNLSTARSVLRSKEVSVRKIIGAKRGHLFFQFVLETGICFAIALILAFAVIYTIMPLYNHIADKEMYFNLFSVNVWKVIGLTVAVTLAASSIYPAVLLSSFQPIEALRSRSTGAGNGGFRKVLVVCQFAFSIGLIIGTLVINRQLKYIQTTQLGFDRDQVFKVNINNNMSAHQEAIKAELLRHHEISGTAVGDNIVSSGSSTGDTDWDGKPKGASVIIHPFSIDKSFINLFKIKFVAGGNFTGVKKADSTHFILNETAIRQAGIKNPIGKRFKLWQTNGTIIGVVKDFHFASLKQAIEPAIFTYTEKSDQIFVRTSGKDAAAAIKLVQNYHEQYNHGDPPFEYKFLDEDFNNLYKTEQNTSTLFNAFACVAIFISCLGLFGLATYTAQVKVKEIGIRKVLGASVMNITTMLSKDFLLLVIISLVIAGPVAWYAMNKWLEDYAYRVPLSWTLIPLAGISALLIALATISFQAIKAALTNPVKSLRSE